MHPLFRRFSLRNGDRLHRLWAGSAFPKSSFAASCVVSALVIASPSMALARDSLEDCTRFVNGWKAAYNAKDARALADMYEPTKGAYSSVFWTGVGHDNLLGGFERELGMGSTMTSIRCGSSTATGDLVLSSGTWSASSPGPDGKPAAIEGHWQSNAVGRAGRYLIIDHTSNMQLPPPR